MTSNQHRYSSTGEKKVVQTGDIFPLFINDFGKLWPEMNLEFKCVDFWPVFDGGEYIAIQWTGFKNFVLFEYNLGRINCQQMFLICKNYSTPHSIFRKRSRVHQRDQYLFFHAWNHPGLPGLFQMSEGQSIALMLNFILLRI